MSKRQMAWLTAIVGTVVVALIVVFWTTLFGPGTWGAGGNMVAWVLCGGLSFLWLNVVQKERHVQALALAARNHNAATEQAARHHREKLDQAERHQQEVLDRIDVHVVALQAQVAAGRADFTNVIDMLRTVLTQAATAPTDVPTLQPTSEGNQP